MIKIPVAKAEKKIREPAHKWKARCYEIACKLVEAKLFEGRAVYGHFIGDADESSIFAHKQRAAGFSQHGWVLQDDGTIIDPTRWTFTGEGPYIAQISPNDEEYEDYDEGGNVLRQVMEKPPPDASVVMGSGKNYAIEDQDARQHIHMLLGKTKRKDGKVTSAQMFWLANLSLGRLDPYAIEIYAELESANLAAFIPQDNRQKVALMASRRMGD